MASHSSILAWRIPWTEEPGAFRPWVHKESDSTEAVLQDVMRETLYYKETAKRAFINSVNISATPSAHSRQHTRVGKG